eukprot:snap_masked-scaffold_8-processed-gene-2.32-mRNA-1 protein AED:1.00 eAED:1.00 QI:0/0/0/0/1/1/2/0/238
MAHLMKLDGEEMLREELLQKHIKYTEENDIQFSPNDVLAFDVSNFRRMSDFKRTYVYGNTPHPETYMESCTDSGFKYPKLLIIPKIIENFIIEFMIFLIHMLICLPYNYFVEYFTFYDQEYGKEIPKYLRQNILVTRKGVFIYLKKIEGSYTCDVKYSPLIWCLVKLDFCSVDDYYTFETRPEEIFFIEMSEIDYTTFFINFFEKNISFLRNRALMLPISEEVKNIIQDARKNTTLPV